MKAIIKIIAEERLDNILAVTEFSQLCWSMGKGNAVMDFEVEEQSNGLRWLKVITTDGRYLISLPEKS